MAATISVEVQHPGGRVQRHRVRADSGRTIKIGTMPSAQLPLADPCAARLHAVLHVGRSELSLIDMGSGHGTWLNGTRVHRASMHPGDEVRVGDTRLRLRRFGDRGPLQRSGSEETPDSAPVVPATAPPRVGVANTDAEPDALPHPPAPAPAPVAVAVPHPSLPAEAPLHHENRCLEMRVYWGTRLVDIRHYQDGKLPTVGESKGADVFVTSEGLPLEAFPLVRRHRDGYLLSFTNVMQGEVEIDGRVLSLQQAGSLEAARRDESCPETSLVPLGLRARALVRIAGLAIALRFVPRPQRPRRLVGLGLDLPYCNTLLASLLTHAAVVAALLLYPLSSGMLHGDLFNQKQRWVRLILDPPTQLVMLPEPPPPPPQTPPRNANADAQPAPQPRPDRTDRALRRSTALPPPAAAHHDATYRRQRDRAHTRFRHMLEQTLGGGSGARLHGGHQTDWSESLGTLLDKAFVLSGGAARSAWGTTRGRARSLGPRSAGRGVGPTQGPGAIETQGRAGGDLDYGRDVSIPQGKRPSALVVIESVSLADSLPRDAVQRVVDANLQQIRYCYERQLQIHQDLEGTIRIRWAIAGTGQVAAARVLENTLGDDDAGSAVARCLVERIRTWRFPQPSGGGTVVVNKPFVFRASGDS